MNYHQQKEDTICAIASPAGMGAIALIRVSGNGCIDLVSGIFKGKNLQQENGYTLHYGTIVNGEEKYIDDVLLSIFKNPRSYTGEDSIEISCHGSLYIQQQILSLLIRKGARLANPGEYTMRAYMNGKLDLSQAEAVADLIASESEAAHRTALQQMRGGYSQELDQLRDDLIHFASLIELELDFGEEDVEFAKRDQLIALIENIQNKVSQLIQSFSYGNAIKNGVPTVIVGKPNAGKSTLLNALLNEERALVSDIAGTTRDTIEELLHTGGLTFRLIDTAGLRPTEERIESMGIHRTLQKLKEARLVIYLYDLSSTLPEVLMQDINELELADGASLIICGNKSDIARQDVVNAILDIPNKIYKFPVHAHLTISSKNKQGTHQLKDEMASSVKAYTSENGLVVTNTRHYQSLLKAEQALTEIMNGMALKISSELLAIDIRRASEHIGEITGTITTDDLLGSIFTRFCIGK